MALQARAITVLQILSALTLIFSITMLPPIFMELYFQDGELLPYLITFLVSIGIGILGWVPTIGYKKSVRTRDGFLVVVLFWVVYSILSALPFFLSTTPEISFVDALFEGISGITTTGATVYANVDALPHSLLYYRAQSNFFGGLGIIVLATAILPLLGIGGVKIYQSETPGPFKEEKLTPRLADTAKILWAVYSVLTLMGLVAFMLAGMGWFDALCHIFATMALGGFSTKGASLGHFNSLGIEMVAGVFTILAAVNFALYFLVYERRSLVPVIKNAEFRFFMAVLFGVTAVVCGWLYVSGSFNLVDSLVHGFTQTASVMTDNGLVVANFPAWPGGIVVLLMFSSFFGGCVGSTCGGIKAMRFLVLYKQSLREIKQLIHPRATITLKVGETVVQDRVVQAVSGFFFLYLFATVFFVIALVFTGLDLRTAFGTVAACINNMGVGDGDTASNFGVLNDTAKWLMCLAMLIGRLEVFPILILLSRTFWRF